MLCNGKGNGNKIVLLRVENDKIKPHPNISKTVTAQSTQNQKQSNRKNKTPQCTFLSQFCWRSLHGTLGARWFLSSCVPSHAHTQVQTRSHKETSKTTTWEHILKQIESYNMRSLTWQEMLVTNTCTYAQLCGTTVSHILCALAWSFTHNPIISVGRECQRLLLISNTCNISKQKKGPSCLSLKSQTGRYNKHVHLS